MTLFAPIFLLPRLVLLLIGLPILFMYLWNTTMPQVFGLRPLMFWEAFRLLLLSAILFGVARL